MWVADRDEHGFDAPYRRIQVDALGLSVETRGEVGRAERWASDVQLAEYLGAVFRQDPDVVGAVDRGQLEFVARPVLEDGVGGRDAEPVAALLGFRPVRVEDPHAHLRQVESEQSVRAQAAIPIA
jgi:hypothetical protein